MNLPFIVTALFFNLSLYSTIMMRTTTATSTTTKTPTVITAGTRNDCWVGALVGESEAVATVVVIEANVDVVVLAAVGIAVLAEIGVTPAVITAGTRNDCWVGASVGESEVVATIVAVKTNVDIVVIAAAGVAVLVVVRVIIVPAVLVVFVQIARS